MSGPIIELSPAVFFDTETTSRDDDREVIEAAYIRPVGAMDLIGGSDRIPAPIFNHVVETFEQRYKPDSAIDFGAMAVHHILPSELEDCPPSGSFQLPDGVEYLIGHSIDFDWEAIGKPDVKRICTYAIAGWLWPECDSKSQSALLYMLRGAIESTRQELRFAHAALADVRNNILLCQEIIEKRELSTWAELYDLSERCRIPRTIEFGKLKGELLSELPKIDYGYCCWLLNQDWLDPYVEKGIRQAMEEPKSDREYCDGLDGACCREPGHAGECDEIPF